MGEVAGWRDSSVLQQREVGVQNRWHWNKTEDDRLWRSGRRYGQAEESALATLLIPMVGVARGGGRLRPVTMTLPVPMFMPGILRQVPRMVVLMLTGGDPAVGPGGSNLSGRGLRTSRVHHRALPDSVRLPYS